MGGPAASTGGCMNRQGRIRQISTPSVEGAIKGVPILMVYPKTWIETKKILAEIEKLGLYHDQKARPVQTWEKKRP